MITEITSPTLCDDSGYYSGDVNSTGEININDINIMVQYILTGSLYNFIESHMVFDL